MISTLLTILFTAAGTGALVFVACAWWFIIEDWAQRVAYAAARIAIFAVLLIGYMAVLRWARRADGEIALAVAIQIVAQPLVMVLVRLAIRWRRPRAATGETVDLSKERDPRRV